MVTLCLQVIQRLITAQVLDGKGAKYVVETMWMLMEANIEEVCTQVYCVHYMNTMRQLRPAGEVATDPDPPGHHEQCLLRRYPRPLSRHLLQARILQGM